MDKELLQRFEPLTPRELDVVVLVAKRCRDSRDRGVDLGVSVHD
jgi:hypothetical protein